MASAIRPLSYNLADHGLGNDPSPAKIKEALKKAVDSIAEKDLQKVRGGQVVLFQ